MKKKVNRQDLLKPNKLLPDYEWFDTMGEMKMKVQKVTGDVTFGMEDCTTHCFISKDKSAGGSKRFLLTSYKRFFKNFLKVKPKNRNYHEVLCHNKPMKLVLDIDIKTIYNKHIGKTSDFIKNICYKVICRQMQLLFKTKLEIEIPFKDFICYNASDETKYSVHIHCINDSAYFKNKLCVRQFLYDLFVECVKQTKDIDMNPFFKFEEDNDKVVVTPTFDFEASSGNSIRLPGCIKMGNWHNEKRRLKFYCLENGNINTCFIPMLKRSMVHYIDINLSDDLWLIDYESAHQLNDIKQLKNDYIDYCQKNNKMPIKNKDVKKSVIYKGNNIRFSQGLKSGMTTFNPDSFCPIELNAFTHSATHELVQEILVNYYNTIVYDKTKHINMKGSITISNIKINVNETRLVVNVIDNICVISYMYENGHIHNNKTGQWFVFYLNNGKVRVRCSHGRCKDDAAKDYAYKNLTMTLGNYQHERLMFTLSKDAKGKTLGQVDKVHEKHMKNVMDGLDELCIDAFSEIKFVDE